MRREGKGREGKAAIASSPSPPPPPGPSPGQPTPGVVKQDKSSRGSVDTTKTRSGPQRVRMSSGERPIGAAKGKQTNTNGPLLQRGWWHLVSLPERSSSSPIDASLAPAAAARLHRAGALQWALFSANRLRPAGLTKGDHQYSGSGSATGSTRGGPDPLPTKGGQGIAGPPMHRDGGRGGWTSTTFGGGGWAFAAKLGVHFFYFGGPDGGRGHPQSTAGALLSAIGGRDADVRAPCALCRSAKGIAISPNAWLHRFL